MAKMTEEIRRVVAKTKPWPIATAAPDGRPNLIYVGFLRILDDETIQIADNRFHKTRQNLEANPQLAVTCWDPESKSCYQVKGSVELVTEGPVYDDCVAWVHASSPTLTPKAAALLHVEEVYSGANRVV